MKRKILLLMLVLFTFFVVGCSDDDASDARNIANPDNLAITNVSGATMDGTNTHFVLYAPNAKNVTVKLFSPVTLDVEMQLTEDKQYWWATATVSAGQNYKYLLDDTTWVSDPYARAYDESDNFNSLIMDSSTYSWNDGGWAKPARSKLVIYEMHIKDFTRNDSDATSGANYLGVIDKIQYLQDLGVNAVELMPIQEWSGGWYSWGYNNSGYFAPESSLSSDISDGSAYDEFKQLVDALHQAGIAVILDVVYNHTSNDQNLLWMIDSDLYFSGSTPWGNRFALELPATSKFVYDNMKYWMDEFHIDGFRLDSTENIDINAAINVVDKLYTEGYSDNYYIFEEFDGGHNDAIRNYNVNKGVRVISSWGAGYKGPLWDLINNGTSGSMGKITYFSHDDGWNYPSEVINYFSSHDEGTLSGRQDASKQSVKTAAVHLLTSLGIPMIWMGDEVARLHYGNHPPSGEGIDEANNEMDWDTLRTDNADLLAYYSGLIKLRIAHANLHMAVDPGVNHNWNTDWTAGHIGYTYKQSGDNGFVVLVNYNKTTAKTFSATFPVTGTWYQMCDGVSATNLAPGLATTNIASTTNSISVPANTAYIYMSQNSL